MTTSNHDNLIQTLQLRFTRNPHRHPDTNWDDIQARLAANPSPLNALAEMERTGGEPDVVVLDQVIGLIDCAPESPAGRRSLCFDQKALGARKENKPAGAAIETAAAYGCGVTYRGAVSGITDTGTV